MYGLTTTCGFTLDLLGCAIVMLAAPEPSPTTGFVLVICGSGMILLGVLGSAVRSDR